MSPKEDEVEMPAFDLGLLHVPVSCSSSGLRRLRIRPVQRRKELFEQDARTGCRN